MFRRLMTISSVMIAALVILGIAKLCLVTKNDIAKYKHLADEYRQLSNQSLSQSATQTRQGVRKDIWFLQEDASRLHYRIESESSLLTLDPAGGKFDIVENLSSIRCWMQEKLYDSGPSSMQQLRFLQAQEGIYRFRQQEFIASSVALSLFRLPGHELVTPTTTRDAFLKGNAENISFSVSGKTPQFEAHKFTASLRQEEN